MALATGTSHPQSPILVAILVVILVGSRGASTKMTIKTTTKTALAKRRQVSTPQNANLSHPGAPNIIGGSVPTGNAGLHPAQE